jgi:hypothetical protein
MRKSLGKNLGVNGDKIKTDVKEDVRLEMESCTVSLLSCGSLITQIACFCPDISRQLGDKVKGTHCS